MTEPQEKYGIIAGSGDLPYFLINALHAAKKSFFIIAITGITNRDVVRGFPHEWLDIGKIGTAIKRLKKENIEKLILTGKVGRPRIDKIFLDFTGIRLLARLKKLKLQGDDTIFSEIINFFTKAGFKIIGIEKVLPELLTPEGVIGNIAPDKLAENDCYYGKNIALEIGRLDIGQAVIVQNRRIIGVEGAEGTDELINRCKDLQDKAFPGGILIKMKKPEQESRVDLPSIGVKTIENIFQARLRGIALEAKASLIIDKELVIKKANKLGIFILGVSNK